MLKFYAYDVEVLPNLFSVTFISINDYLLKFKDCVNDKNKAIPLTEKYTVKEIKEKLKKVETHIFCITDTNDNDLLPMVSFIEQMGKRDNNNKIIDTYHVYGFNSYNYDKLMISSLLMNYRRLNTTKELITKLYKTSKKIIEEQDLPNTDKSLEHIKKFRLPYFDIDIMKIFALNKVGNFINDKGEVKFFGKSLKQTSINIKWYNLLEYELPPICDKDIHFYHNNDLFRGVNAERLNMIIDKWDRYILEEYVPDLLRYNTNDVFILCELVRLYSEEIKIRYSISQSYNINVLNSSRSDIADKLFIKFYSEFSGLKYSQWKGTTERTIMSFNKVILPGITFKTDYMNSFLKKIKEVKIYATDKKSFNEIIKINNTSYNIATGGIHSVDKPQKLKSKILINGEIKELDNFTDETWNEIDDDSYVLMHYDIASFYPSLMSIYQIYPEHLNQGVFTSLITWLKDTRVKAKHSKDELYDGVNAKLLAEVLKIVINSIYGKLGYKYGDLYDRMAVLKVTINGQLLMLMLCEELELNGINVISANTDGIIIKLYKKDKEKFDTISNNWKQFTKLEADYEYLKYYICRDVNNYIAQEFNGKLSNKGSLNPNLFRENLAKGYNMPIVAKAVNDFLLYNKNVLETLYESTDILDFCATQNIGRQFHVALKTEKNGLLVVNELQKNVRYYVSNNGGNLYKVHNDTGSYSGLSAGNKIVVINELDDLDISFRDIDYNYYYRESLKIIDPIMLGIDPKSKSDPIKKTVSGKKAIEKYSGYYKRLFDE